MRAKVLKLVKSVLWAFAIAAVVRTFIMQASIIPSGSMLPGLLPGDCVMVNKLIYGTIVDIPLTGWGALFHTPGLRSPQRGEVIVFRFPEDPSIDYIKRVVAVAGDTVAYRHKTLFISESVVSEPYVQHIDAKEDANRDSFGPFRVPPGKLFVMGDNRDESNDSRYWRYLDVSDVRGRAEIIYWSREDGKAPLLDRIGKRVR